MSLSLADLVVCTEAAARGDATRAARALMRRLRLSETVPEPTAGVLSRLGRFATVSEADMEAFEGGNDVYRVAVSDGSDAWLAPRDHPPLIPRHPRFSMRGLRALALAVLEEVQAERRSA